MHQVRQPIILPYLPLLGLAITWRLPPLDMRRGREEAPRAPPVHRLMRPPQGVNIGVGNGVRDAPPDDVVEAIPRLEIDDHRFALLPRLCPSGGGVPGVGEALDERPWALPPVSVAAGPAGGHSGGQGASIGRIAGGRFCRTPLLAR